MKKLVLTLSVCLLVVSSLFAQYKMEANSVSMEVLFSPVSLTSGSVKIPEYGVKARYFLTEQWNVRLQLGFQNTSENTVSYFDNDKQHTSNIESSTMFTFFPGFEYHFVGNDRISPYVGAELGFGINGTSDKTTNTQNSDHSYTKQKDVMFGIGAVTGVDIYVYKGLFLGVELNLGMQNIRENSTSSEVSVGSSTVTTDPKDYVNTNSIGFSCVPSLRLGWSF